jgi:integrase
MWQRWMKKAEEKGVTHFTENDLRKKAVEGESLQRAQELLRHTTAQTTKKHYAIRDKISTN